MNELWRRLRHDLRTTLIGVDPALPMKPPRSVVSALGLILLVTLGAMEMGYLEANQVALPAAAVIVVLTVLSLVFVRFKPLWAWRFIAASFLIGLLDPGMPNSAEGWPWNPVQILAALVVLFAVGLREPLGVIFWCGLISVVIVWVVIHQQEVIGITILIAVIMVFGEQIQRRRRAQREAKKQAERSEMLTERARIARELHDVVAHSLSLVAVRAETAPYRIKEVGDPAREEFLALASTARESLTELRRLLGVLRTEPGNARAPQPALEDVGQLIDTMRSAGMDIAFVGTDCASPPAAGLTAYRIVQEALSNAARHAPGAPVRVGISQEAAELRVEVHNGPSPDARSRSRKLPGKFPDLDEGHGLVGMRERVSLLGGTIHYGQSDDGGFTVSAVIPV